MSRRSNTPRRVTNDALRDLDQHTQANMRALLAATLSEYHERNVKPLEEWAALPWWRRLWRTP